MMKRINGRHNPTGTLKRVCLALVVLLLASALLVGAGSADEVKTTTVTVTSPETIDSKLIGDVLNNQTIIIELSAGDYAFPKTADLKSKNVTFKGAEGTTKDTVSVNLTYLTKVEDVNLVTNIGGTNLTFDNVTVNWVGTEGYQGLKTTGKVVYENCIINGLQYLYGDADFIGCTFTNKIGWSVWTYSAKNVKFEGCTFNTGGHAVLNYNDYVMSENFVANVVFTKCKFINDGSLKEESTYTWQGPEQLVETGVNSNAPGKTYYNIEFTDCEIEGDGKQSLWGNKNSMDNDHLKVTINDAKQDLIYRVTWQYDAKNAIAWSFVKDGEKLVYTGETPTKQADDDEHIYQFTGWTPALTEFPTVGSFTATFEKVPIEVDADLNVTTETTDAGTKVTVKEGDIAYEGENANAVTEATITTASNVNVTLIYSAEDKAKVDETQKTITGNVTEVVAEYPETLLDSDVSGIKYELKLNLKPETVANGEIPLPNITTTLNQNVVNAIGLKTGGDGEAFKPLAMIAAEYAAGIDKVNNNLTGDEKITLTFVVPATAGQSFVAFHIVDGADPELLDANKVKTDSTSKPGFVIITLTVDHFSGYAIAEGTYPVVKKETPSSSSSSGSSVWLMETQTPTPTPTPTETEKPTDAVPTDIPVTQPTETPASPAFGALAVLAGLGAVAVLRRK